jgi:tetratricopeptide (TPR) repeat protein
MKNSLFLLSLLLLLADTLPAQTKIVGFVKRQSSGNEALVGAEVWAIGSAAKQERFSNSKGYFELEFPTKTAGQVIRDISVTLDGYEVVNKKKLESYGLIAQPEDNPLIIVLCKTGNYRRAAAAYYQTIFDVGATELKAEKERLEKQLDQERENRTNLEKQLKQINAQLEHLPEVAEAAANYFAKIDTDQATQLQQKALKELEAGNIQAALDAMPEDEMDRNMANALTRKQQLEEELAKTNQAIEQNIENYIFKAKLYVSQANYPAAERLYEKAIAADTSRIEHLYDYAIFLEEINRYDKGTTVAAENPPSKQRKPGE